MNIFRKNIASRVRKLKKLKATAAKKGAGVDKLYDYLRGTYWHASHCANGGIPRTYMRAAGGDPSDCNVSDFIEVFINASSTADRRVRWKQSGALKFVALKKKEPRQLKAFMRKHGGIKGCAAKYLKAKAKIKAKAARATVH